MSMTFLRTLLSTILLSLSLLSLSCVVGSLGVPKGGRAVLVEKSSVASLTATGRLVRIGTADDFHLVTAPGPSLLRVDHLGNDLVSDDYFDILMSHGYDAFKVYPLEGGRLLVIGVVDVMKDDDIQQVTYEAQVIDLAKKASIATETIGTIDNDDDDLWNYVSVTISPEGSHALVTLWDYSDKEHLTIDGTLLDLATLSTTRRFTHVHSNPFTVSHPIFIGEERVVFVQSDFNKEITQLALVNAGDSTPIATIDRPKKMANEIVNPFAFASEHDSRGGTIVAVGMVDHDIHTKGLLLTRIDEKGTTLTQISAKEFPHMVAERLIDHEDLIQFLPMDIVESDAGTIHVIMEGHHSYREIFSDVRTGSRKTMKSERWPFLPSRHHEADGGLLGKKKLEYINLVSRGVVVVSYDATGKELWEAGLAQYDEPAWDFSGKWNDWSQFADRHWHGSHIGPGSLSMMRDGRLIVVYRAGGELRGVEFDPASGSRIDSYTLFETALSRRMLMSDAVWSDRRTILLPVQPYHNRIPFEIYKVRVN